MLVVLESTTYSGTTEEILTPILEESGLVCGISPPDHIDPVNKNYDTMNTPKVIGGVTEKCTQIATSLYESVLKGEIIVSSPKIA